MACWEMVRIRMSFASKRTACIVAVAACLPLFAFAAEPKWPVGPYKYVVINQDVREVLTEFGRNTGLPVKISDQVQSRRLRGPFAVTAASEFLKTVCESAGLVWYYDGAVLHIASAGEITTASVDVGRQVAWRNIRKQLHDLGVLDERYLLRTDGASGIVTVAGPPAYIATIRQALHTIEKSSSMPHEITNGDDRAVRVFRAGRDGT